MNVTPKILYVVRDNGGCGFYRCLQPVKFLNRAGFAKATTVLRSPSPEQLLDADLVVMQEMGSMEAGNIANFLIENKKPFIAEVDDFLHHISPRNLGGFSAWNPGTLYTHRAMEFIRKANALIVSTPQLAREYFPYNENVYVMPNYLDKDVWDIPISRRADGKIRIGWCGGNAHADDLKMVAPVIEKITKEHDGKVIFETMGMLEQELSGVFNGRPSTENPCPSCRHEGTLHHFMGETQENFPGVLASRGWDVAIAPVINNAFGNCKSDLKVKEYAALGYPVVASLVTPYREAQNLHGAPLYLAESFHDWYVNLKLLIDDEELRRNTAKNMKEWAEKNWIQDRIPEIFEIHKDVLMRYAQAHGLPPR